MQAVNTQKKMDVAGTARPPWRGRRRLISPDGAALASKYLQDQLLLWFRCYRTGRGGCIHTVEGGLAYLQYA